jgi:hypothetical protein
MRGVFESEGDIRSVDLLSALVTLWRERSGDSLRFSRPGATAGFDLIGGEVVATLSSQAQFDTAAILIRAGKLEPAAVGRLALPEGSDATVAAMQAGLINERDWRWAQKMRAIEVLSDLLGWLEGEYVREPGVAAPPGEWSLPLPRLVLELFLRSRDRSLIEHSLGASDLPLLKAGGFDEEFETFGLTSDAGAVVALIDGRASAEEIAENSNADEFAVLKLLAALTTLGLVHPEEAAPAADLRRPSPAVREPGREARGRRRSSRSRKSRRTAGRSKRRARNPCRRRRSGSRGKLPPKRWLRPAVPLPIEEEARPPEPARAAPDDRQEQPVLHPAPAPEPKAAAPAFSPDFFSRPDRGIEAGRSCRGSDGRRRAASGSSQTPIARAASWDSSGALIVAVGLLPGRPLAGRRPRANRVRESPADGGGEPGLPGRRDGGAAADERPADARSYGRGLSRAARHGEGALAAAMPPTRVPTRVPPDAAADRRPDPSVAHERADGDPDASRADAPADRGGDTRRADEAADGGRDPTRADPGADGYPGARRVSRAAADGRGFLPKREDARGVDRPGGAGQAGPREAARRPLCRPARAGVRGRDAPEGVELGPAFGHDLAAADVLSRPDLLPRPVGPVRKPRPGQGGQNAGAGFLYGPGQPTYDRLGSLTWETPAEQWKLGTRRSAALSPRRPCRRSSAGSSSAA